jgi:nucleoside-diphosphate-sugar epimerase
MIAVTGGSGFIGRTLCSALAEASIPVRAVVRPGEKAVETGIERAEIRDLLDISALRRAFQGASAVVHLAGRAHRMPDNGLDTLAEFRRVNVEGTRAVMEAAAAARVRRCLVASSIKAVGDRNTTPWTEATLPAPSDPYGVSKLESERAALEHGARSAVEVVVMRFPLVYGPGAAGNVRRLLRLVDRGIPLPFGGIRNRRTMLFTGNLVSSVRALLEAPGVSGEVFFLGDGVDLSTADLIRTIAWALDRPARLWPVPVSVLRLGGLLTRRSAEIARLVGSLSVSVEKLQHRTGWRAPFTPARGWGATAAWYREAFS